MGLTKHHEKMKKLMKTSSPFGECVQSFTGCKGFTVDTNIKSLTHPLHAVPGKVYLVQIASHFDGMIDNSHSIAIYNGNLYDINHTSPLCLTRDNVDSCCVGSEWKFSHVSRVCAFVPTIWMKKLLDQRFL